MKYISWNVNGLRACVKKGFVEFFEQADSDIFCVQETKLQAGQIELDLPGYQQYWSYAVKKGYSGTAVFTRETPQSVTEGIGLADYDQEGRVITMEFADFFFLTVYTPNSQRKLTRLDYRMEWEDAFRNYILELEARKPVIVCGDLNVAHQEIDLANPDTNHRNAGFTDEERAKFSRLLASGFVDTFRCLYPDRTDAYTWWSYFANSRERNIGWRIDYFLVSAQLKDRVRDAAIHADVMGSDHCPVSLEVDL